MKTDKKIVDAILTKVYTEGIKPLIIGKENIAYIKDPVFGLIRNRVVAEILKALLRINIEPDKDLIKKLINFILINQNKDGSWNEIHPNYNQPSSLITSIVGEALLQLNEREKEKRLEDAVHKAKEYILSQKRVDGILIKSKEYTADHLNVDATCGAFLSYYGVFFNDKQCKNISRQIARHIFECQFPDGSYPYTTDRGSYSYVLNVPCIHYQGVTLYYLIKIYNFLPEEFIKVSILNGCKWLVSVQKDNGRFDWSKSGLMFAYYLTGAYAFSAASLIYASRWDNKFLESGYKSINVLQNNYNSLFLRWERDNWKSFIPSIYTTFKTSNMGVFPIKQKLFRFGYGFYRQMARRRFSFDIDDKFFNEIVKTLKIKTSTIESFSNYPDLFMTSEIFDSLSTING